MSKTPKMGRGLDALWGGAPVAEETSSPAKTTTVLAVELLEPSPYQPRRQFQEAALRELADSISQQGIIQPLLVRKKVDQEGYEIVAGERRWRAAQLANLSEVPVFIKEFSDEEVMAAALIENIQREDLSPIEEALAIQSLRDHCGITQEELAKRLGKSRSAIANTLRLLLLPEPMQGHLSEGHMQAGHARTLLSLQDDLDAQTRLFVAIQQQNMSVRDVEAAVNFFKEHHNFPWEVTESPAQEGVENTAEEEKTTPKQTSRRSKSPYIKSLQNKIKERLTIKTAVSGSEERGRITLTYTNAEELAHILLHLGLDQNADDSTFPVKQ